MSLWAGFNMKNVNMVCIMILGPFDAFRNSRFSLIDFDVSIILHKLMWYSKLKGRDYA